MGVIKGVACLPHTQPRYFEFLGKPPTTVREMQIYSLHQLVKEFRTLYKVQGSQRCSAALCFTSNTKFLIGECIVNKYYFLLYIIIEIV